MADGARSLESDRPAPLRSPRSRDSGNGAAPHDLEAEESLIGAMLLSATAIDAAVELVNAGDFYRPSHGYIFSAVTSLASRGDPVDAITVQDELRRAGLLEHIGDPTMLVALQTNTPSTSSAGHYARIVATRASERRLLGHARELADAVLSEDGPRQLRAVEAIAGDSDDAPGIGGQLVRIDLAELLRNPPPRIEAELLARSDGKCLLVKGAVTLVNAEPSVGKTWLAVEVASQVATAGGTAVVLDYEGSERTWVERLMALGVTPELAERIHYFRPNGAPVHVVLRAVLAYEPDLVVADGLAAAMAQAGLDENAARDCLVWLRGTARAIALEGAAVMVIDHVTKDRDSRGRWGRGNGAKLGEADVAFGFELVEPYARDKAGLAKLRIHKDRFGAIGPEKSVAADVTFTPADGDRLVIELKPSTDDPEWQGPTDCMSIVGAFLENTGEEYSINALVGGLRAIGRGFGKKTVTEAADRLAMDRHSAVVSRAGARGSRLYQWDPAAVQLGPEADDEDEGDWRDEPF